MSRVFLIDYITQIRCILSPGYFIHCNRCFVLNVDQAKRLINLADEKGLKLTVGHNDQFSHVARRMRALIESGYLGLPPLTDGYDL